MFTSSRNKPHASHHKVQKASFSKKHSSFLRSSQTTAQQQQRVERSFTGHSQANIQSPSAPISPSLNSSIITIAVGRTARLFAAHEQVLVRSPYFAELLRKQYYTHTPNSPTHAGENAKRIELPNQEAEVFSSVLEYLYKGDYYPRLEYDKKRDVWGLEDGGRGEVTVAWNGGGAAGDERSVVLKDTAIYCAATLYALSPLARLALKKQGLQQGIQCATILTSARFAYANTPDTDSRLRAHYLALIIRSRDVFKRSGSMQAEMERGGRLWFDLFVALVNHLDDVAGVGDGR